MHLVKTERKSYALYFFIYCALGVFCPLIGQYLNSIGFTGTQVGIVTSLGTGISVVSGLFWGKIYSNADHKKHILLIMILASAIMALISIRAKTFLIFALVYGGMYFFQGPLHGLCDSMMISNGNNFSIVRAFGALGYAVSVYFAGQFAEVLGLQVIFYLYAASFILAALVMLREDEPPIHKNPEERVKVLDLINNRDYMKLLLVSFFIMGSISALNTYFGYLYRQVGGSISGIGIAFLLMTGCEAPFMFLIPILKKKIPSEKLIMIAMMVQLTRQLLMGFFPSVPLLIGTFFMQGFSNGVILVELVNYFGKVVEPKLSSIGVATFYAVGNSLSAIICNLLGGVILDLYDAKAVFICFSAFTLMGLIIYCGLGLTKEKESNG